MVLDFELILKMKDDGLPSVYGLICIIFSQSLWVIYDFFAVQDHYIYALLTMLHGEKMPAIKL